MKTTVEFIDDIKAKYGLKSNYAVAKFLNQTDTAVARWAHGKGSFGDETSIKIAELLDIEPAYVFACMHAERAKHAGERAVWERIAALAIGVTAALSVFAIIPIEQLPNGAQYGLIALSTSSQDAVYYVKLLVRRIFSSPAIR